MASDEQVASQILSIFMAHRIRPGQTLRRNYFLEVRDAEFRRGLDRAVEYGWVEVNPRDRYTYKLTQAGLVQGSKRTLAVRPDIEL